MEKTYLQRMKFPNCFTNLQLQIMVSIIKIPPRQITSYVLTAFCGMGYKEICKFINNITASCCANLSNKGFDIIKQSMDLKSFVLDLCKN